MTNNPIIPFRSASEIQPKRDHKIKVLEALAEGKYHLDMIESIYFEQYKGAPRAILWTDSYFGGVVRLKIGFTYLRPETVIMNLINIIHTSKELSEIHPNKAMIPIFFVRMENEMRLWNVSQLNENSDNFNQIQSIHFAPLVIKQKITFYYIFQLIIKSEGVSYSLKKVINPNSSRQTRLEEEPIKYEANIAKQMIEIGRGIIRCAKARKNIKISQIEMAFVISNSQQLFLIEIIRALEKPLPETLKILMKNISNHNFVSKLPLSKISEKKLTEPSTTRLLSSPIPQLKNITKMETSRSQPKKNRHHRINRIKIDLKNLKYPKAASFLRRFDSEDKLKMEEDNLLSNQLEASEEKLYSISYLHRLTKPHLYQKISSALNISSKINLLRQPVFINSKKNIDILDTASKTFYLNPNMELSSQTIALLNRPQKYPNSTQTNSFNQRINRKGEPRSFINRPKSVEPNAKFATLPKTRIQNPSCETERYPISNPITQTNENLASRPPSSKDEGQGEYTAGRTILNIQFDQNSEKSKRKSQVYNEKKEFNKILIFEEGIMKQGQNSIPQSSGSRSQERSSSHRTTVFQKYAPQPEPNSARKKMYNSEQKMSNNKSNKYSNSSMKKVASFDNFSFKRKIDSEKEKLKLRDGFKKFTQTINNTINLATHSSAKDDSELLKFQNSHKLFNIVKNKFQKRVGQAVKKSDQVGHCMVSQKACIQQIDLQKRKEELTAFNLKCFYKAQIALEKNDKERPKTALGMTSNNIIPTIE